MKDADKQHIIRALVGGGAVGGGVGIVTSLVNHLKTMNRRADAAKETDGDDDVIYVNVPKRHGVKAAAEDPEAPSAVATTLAMASVPVAALGANALVRKIHSKLKRRQLQQELDEAQQVYVDTLASKSASDEQRTGGLFRNSEALMGLPAAALLVALTSGVLSNKVLEKQFPALKSPRRTSPRRMVLREVEPSAEAGMIKEQSFDDSFADACEHLVRSVLAHPVAGAASGLEDLVKAAAAGRTEEILRASDESMETVFELVKGAADTASSVRRDMAIAWLVREPELMPSVVKLAAAEYREIAPVFCAMAANMDTEQQDVAVKAAADFCRLHRYEKYENAFDLTGCEKAATVASMADLLQQGLEEDDSEAQTKDPELQLGGTTAIESETPDKDLDIVARGEEAKRFLERNKDSIDDIFSPEKKDIQKVQEQGA